jgi:hypothetical protein
MREQLGRERMNDVDEVCEMILNMFEKEKDPAT